MRLFIYTKNICKYQCIIKLTAIFLLSITLKITKVIKKYIYINSELLNKTRF